MDPKVWRESIQNACKVVFNRLEININGDHKKRDNVLARMVEQFITGNMKERPEEKCFLVKRENTASKSPFQVQVLRSRILAQKIIYAAFRSLNATSMGTWQVRQTCLHPDGTWWCFEPTHLEKCQRDHVPSTVKQHQLPFVADAFYVPRSRQSWHAQI